ncbi:hypothetical protein PT285_09750 [Lactobacillus sp. ESL0791]|uniref:hypothetical protein n=1 Tax=Lactobacillus sp. ESL0791 TaxID=2983234 RepID=UPI0023F974D2|nr:hypothetical protein [Lactobacillus sp. ESL0791]MDF7639683.1 hypothetical protein [Lactobacillus sp. ESL0791]
MLDEAVKILFSRDKLLNTDDRSTVVFALDKLELKFEELDNSASWEPLELVFRRSWELAEFFESLTKLLDDAAMALCANKLLKADDRSACGWTLCKLEAADELNNLDNCKLAPAPVLELSWELVGFFEPLVKLSDDAAAALCDNRLLTREDNNKLSELELAILERLEDKAAED